MPTLGHVVLMSIYRKWAQAQRPPVRDLPVGNRCCRMGCGAGKAPGASRDVEQVSYRVPHSSLESKWIRRTGVVFDDLATLHVQILSFS